MRAKMIASFMSFLNLISLSFLKDVAARGLDLPSVDWIVQVN